MQRWMRRSTGDIVYEQSFSQVISSLSNVLSGKISEHKPRIDFVIRMQCCLFCLKASVLFESASWWAGPTISNGNTKIPNCLSKKKKSFSKHFRVFSIMTIVIILYNNKSLNTSNGHNACFSKIRNQLNWHKTVFCFFTNYLYKNAFLYFLPSACLTTHHRTRDCGTVD